MHWQNFDSLTYYISTAKIHFFYAHFESFIKCNCRQNFLSAKVPKLSPIQYFPIHISKVAEASKLRVKVIFPLSTSFDTSFMACKADLMHFTSYRFLSYAFFSWIYIKSRNIEIQRNDIQKCYVLNRSYK